MIDRFGHSAGRVAAAWLPAGLGIFAAAIAWSIAAPAPAQIPPQIQLKVGGGIQAQPNANADQTTAGVFRDSRETRLRLKKAKQLLKDGRFSEALPMLDDILEGEQDFFDRTQNHQIARNGLKSEARRLIGAQSPEGLKAYELLFGPKAQQMLAEALSADDMAGVAEVARRFFDTQAGYEATLLLGRHQLDHNEPLAAALCFQRLQATPAAEKFEPALSVMLAVCWHRGGMDQRAIQVLADLKKRSPDATVRIAGKEVEVFGSTAGPPAIAWLNEHFGSSRADGAVESGNWAIYRGNSARNALSGGGMPLLNPRWASLMILKGDAVKTAGAAQQENLERNLTSLPVMQPLAVANWVLMRTPSGLTGLDFHSGKRIWEIRAPIEQAPERPVTNGFVRINGMIMSASDPSLTDRLWENATYGTFSSDGHSVFLLREPVDANGAPAASRWQRFPRPNGINSMLTDNPTNQLAAYDLQTQGKFEWQVGGDKTDNDVEPPLAGAFFLGPPLPLMGRLYALAEIKGEIRLAVLDDRSGKVKVDWSQQLALPEDPNPVSNAFRRTTGLSPSYADGILVCPTSAGAVVAVDVANRALLWGYEYPHVEFNQQQQFMAMRFGNAGANNYLQHYMGDRWSDATVTIAEGCVILTPVESDQLFCLSLIDGKLLWKMDRGDNIYVAGVRDGKVLLVGRKQMQAFELADGKPGWPAPLLLPQGSMPSGRGYMSGTSYFLPLSTAEVAAVNVNTGKLLARAKSRKGIVPGNLICYQGTVISQGMTSIDAFYQIEPLEQSAAKALAANPDDPKALADRGNAELDQGKIAPAIVNLQKSYRLQASASTRELLVEALLADLKRDFSAARGTVPELRKLIVFDSERITFLRLLADGLAKSGDRLSALDAYLKLIDLPSTRGEPEVIDASLSVRRDRWIRARVTALYQRTSGAVRAQFDAAVTRG